MRWHIQIPYTSPLFKISFTPIKGEHGPLCILATCGNSGAARICQRGPSEGAKRPSGGRVWEGGFPLPCTVGRFFWKFVYQNEISCTLNVIIKGLVMWSDVYQSPTLPFFEKLFYSNQGDVPLAMPVTVVQPGFVNGGESDGAKRPSGGRVWERGLPPPTVGRFSKILAWKRHFLAH